MKKPISLLETFLCIGPRAPFRKNHFRRLRRSAKKIGISVPRSLEKQVTARIRTLEDHPHRARLTLAPDGSMDLSFHRYDASWTDSDDPPEDVLISLKAPPDYPGAWPGLKTTSRRGLESAYAKAKARSATDALLHRSSIVCETTRANIFWIKSGVVFTPSLTVGCLPGIMREWTLRQLREWNVPVRQGRYALTDIADADAVFRTNALIGVRWVQEISGLKKWSPPVAGSRPLVARLQMKLRNVFRKRS